MNLIARGTTYLRILAGPYERPAEYLDLVYRLVSNYIHLKTNKIIKIDGKRSKQRLHPKLNENSQILNFPLPHGAFQG